MTTATLTPHAAHVQTAAAAADLLHTVCCDENLALCGADVTDQPWTDTGQTCTTCDRLEAARTECACP